MQFKGLALIASAFIFAACGGTTEDSAANTTPAADAPAAAPSGPVAMAEATGTTHEIKMIGDDKGYRFEPANLTIKAGDAIKYVFVSMGPHNVQFLGDSLNATQKAQLDANMGSERIAELMSNMYTEPGQGITVSFANLPAGRYPYTCTPHIAMGMNGVITVQ